MEKRNSTKQPSETVKQAKALAPVLIISTLTVVAIALIGRKASG